MRLVDRQKILRFLRRPLEVVALRYIFGFMVLAPTIMYLFWMFSPKQEAGVIIINKSVPSVKSTEHAGLSWSLKRERVVAPDHSFYRQSQDYYGFHPRAGGDFVIRDFSQMDSLEMDSLVIHTDLIYLADAYGVYSHNYGGDPVAPNRLLYGGMNSSDLALLKQARAKNILTVAEFSMFGPPTPAHLRDSLETLFGLKWSGWVGRYFISLDTTANDALPPWVVNLYAQNYGESWPFRDSGIVLVQGSNIVILEYGTHLLQETPFIETQKVYQDRYKLPETVPYPFWFDIVSSPTTENRVVSIFHLPVNAKGDSLIRSHNIPRLFPAVLHHPGRINPFYYFAGDFSDNAVIEASAYFKGIAYFQSFFYNTNQTNDRRQFFWRYYRPLMKTLLSDLNASVE